MKHEDPSHRSTATPASPTVQQRAPAPGKVTRTSKLPGRGAPPVQRLAAAPGSNATENREQFWRLFQTIIHEYMHTLTHARYSQYAHSLGDPRGHTLREGVTDVLTTTVWSTVEGNITPALRQRVEGPYCDAATPSQPPPLGTYPQTQEAEQVISTCGLRNMYAAYFNGHINLIGAP
jgi:hypothetical protein